MTDNLRKLGYWAIGVVVIGAAMLLILPETDMAIAMTALLTAILGTVLFGEERLPLVVVSLAMLLIGGLDEFHHLIQNMEWVLFIKLAALLTWVDFLAHSRYFDYLIEHYLPRRLHGFPLMAFLFLLTAFSAALIDEVNSIVLWYLVVRSIIGFTQNGTFKFKKASWVALVILMVSSTNIGSQFLPLGNPVGIAISVVSGLNAVDFIQYTWLPALVTLVYFTLRVRFTTYGDLIAEFHNVTANKADFQILEGQHHQYEMVEFADSSETQEQHAVQVQSPPIGLMHALFGIGVVGLVAATPISDLLKVDSATGLGVFVLLLFAATLFIASSYGRHTEVMLSSLPWNTLFFIVFLFGIAHGLETSGLTKLIADELQATFGDNQMAIRIAIIVVGALVTAFMDNVIAIAIIAPIITELGERDIPTTGLWFTLLVSAVVAGNLTPIGSTANIIANARIRTSWGNWWRVGGLLALECLIVNQVTLYLWEQVIA
jgi:Na+/H+ antiporter NhaD/arsenite permease-like protein